jgi:UDP-4-amino-4,6-dideoxy-N-acetyl-beta-L-altrosamine transaminase
MIPYGKQEITNEDIDHVVAVLKSSYLTQGPIVKLFEEKFAKYVGAKFAVSVSNATAALHIAVRSLKKNDKKVLCTPLSFVASSNCVLYENLEVDFVDISPKTFNIDPDKLIEKLKRNPGAYQGIIPVNFAGLPADLERIKAIANEFDLWIIEDACHSVGSLFNNSLKKSIMTGSCTYSNIAVFSFHPVKHITSGEGGILTTNDEEIYEKLLGLRSHGIERNPSKFINKSDGPWYYEMQQLGYNYRLPDINASLVSSQLDRIQKNIERRRIVAGRYRSGLKGLPIRFQEEKEGFVNSHHLFVIMTSHRNSLYQYLKDHEIFCQIHYIPIYRQPFYKEMGFDRHDYPVAEKYYSECLSIPMFHSITDAEIDTVIFRINEFYKHNL